MKRKNQFYFMQINPQLYNGAEVEQDMTVLTVNIQAIGCHRTLPVYDVLATGITSWTSTSGT